MKDFKILNKKINKVLQTHMAKIDKFYCVHTINFQKIKNTKKIFI